MPAPAGGQFFGLAICEVEWGWLAVVKGGSVDGVDSGQFQLVGGESSEDSGFGTVCMDNLGAEVSECLADGFEGAQVLEWVEAADEFGQHDEVESAIACLLFERAFGAGSGAGDQADIVAEHVVLVIDIEEGVFLSAADDQPGDDMSGAHGSVCRRTGSNTGWWQPTIGRIAVRHRSAVSGTLAFRTVSRFFFEKIAELRR